MAGAAGALVGVGHGTAFFQAPFAGADGAKHATRTRRGGGDDAGLAAVKAVGHLHHQGDVLLARAVVAEGGVLTPGDQAFAGGDIAAAGLRDVCMAPGVIGVFGMNARV